MNRHRKGGIRRKMNEFNENRLREFNLEKKNDITGKVEEISEAIKDMEETVKGIRNASDDVELLRHAKEAHKRLNMLEIRYMGLLNLKRKLDMIDEDEYTSLLNAISSDKYENVYPLIKDFEPGTILDELGSADFTPEKGTPAYCECKGYYDIRRIDMGKMIKADLLKEYPGLNFSVKTDGTNSWNERALVRITKTRPEILNQYGGFKDEFIRELRSFLSEYEPRIRVGLETYRW